ncbi:uncharacterized protein [Bemisia tabaci]|uniref:uncharacterized protein n=1 Tax=Bemisia tabaci TaxID=7038 RepID=UPI003B2896E0
MTQDWNQTFQPGLREHNSAQMDPRGYRVFQEILGQNREIQAQQQEMFKAQLEVMKKLSQSIIEWNRLTAGSNGPRSAEGPIISIKAPTFKRLFNGESDYEIRDFLKDFETYYRNCSDKEKREQLRCHLGKRAVLYYDNEEVSFMNCRSFDEVKQRLIEYFDADDDALSKFTERSQGMNEDPLDFVQTKRKLANLARVTQYTTEAQLVKHIKLRLTPEYQDKVMSSQHLTIKQLIESLKNARLVLSPPEKSEDSVLAINRSPEQNSSLDSRMKSQENAMATLAATVDLARAEMDTMRDNITSGLEKLFNEASRQSTYGVPPNQGQYQPYQGQYQPFQPYQPYQGQLQSNQRQYQPSQGQYQPIRGQFQSNQGQYQQQRAGMPSKKRKWTRNQEVDALRVSANSRNQQSRWNGNVNQAVSKAHSANPHQSQYKNFHQQNNAGGTVKTTVRENEQVKILSISSKEALDPSSSTIKSRNTFDTKNPKSKFPVKNECHMSFAESDVGARGVTVAHDPKRAIFEETENSLKNDCKKASRYKIESNFSNKEVILDKSGYDFSDSNNVDHEPIYIRSVIFAQDNNVEQEVHSLPDFNDTNFGSNASLSSVSDSSEKIGLNKGSVEPVRERGDPDTFKICKSEESPAACETQDGDFHNIQIFPTEFKSCSQGEFPNAVLEFASLTRNAFPVHVA